MSGDRIKIRCPNCQTDGSARAELTNRKVSCKHCAHVFRAVSIDDVPAPETRGATTVAAGPPQASDSATKQPSKQRVEALEREIRKLRDDLSAEQAAVGEIDKLRDQLARALDAAKKAEAREQALQKEVEELRDQTVQVSGNEGKNSLREEELRFLRDQLDRARAEAESEARKRRETASILASRTAEYADTITGLKDEHGRTLKAREDDHARALADRDSGHAQALKSRDDDHALALKIKLDEHAQALEARSAGLAEGLASKEAEHAKALQDVRAQLDRARSDAQAVEARRMAADAAMTEAENRHADEVKALREELGRAQAAHEEARAALDGLRQDREHAQAEHSRQVDELTGRLAGAEAALADLEATRADRDRLAAELDGLRVRLSDVERQANEHRDGAEGLRQDRDRVEARRSAEVADLRHQLERARAERDRFSEQLDALQERLVEADQRVAELGYASTEMEVPRADPSSEIPAYEAEGSTVYDGGIQGLRDDYDRARADAESLRVEAESLRAELTGAADRLALKDVEIADLARSREAGKAEAELEARRALDEAETLRRELEQARAATRANGQAEADRGRADAEAEVESLRRELERARASADAASRSNLELAARIKALESTPPPPATVAPSTAAAADDPAAVEAERKRAVDDAVKGAWADFERRLAETQAKLRAANSRADMLEIEAREAREQFAARERGLDLGDGSSFEEAQSMTTIRILDDRGTARLTRSEAEARLALARQLAVERKDKSLIDRIAKMADKVHADLEARNYTLAETLVRGAEIETGLDPGGFSINGQRIFRSSQTIINNLAALAPAFDRVMRQGDLAVIRQTIDEMKTILGDQAGLPEIRRPGRTPAIKRPTTEADAFRLFIGTIEGENWLIRPISIKKPLPDTSLTTYAALIEACCDARGPAERHAPERLPLLQSIIQAGALMLARRQQPDGHFAFLDPRGKASRLASMVDGMVAQSPGAVKDGWVVQVDPIGVAQTESAACALALASAGKALGKPDWTLAAMKAADWAMGQPVLPNFVANAASASLLARAYLDGKQDRHLAGLTRKLSLGLLPGQVENGRWVDASSATTPNHLAILRALHDAYEAIPAGQDDLRRELRVGIDRGMNSLLAECKSLGVPAQGNALRDLIRHRDLFQPDIDGRVEPAILDSVTVIQELCHDGPRPKLGVAPDQLAALMKA